MERRAILSFSKLTPLVLALLYLGYGDMSYDPSLVGGCPDAAHSTVNTWTGVNGLSGEVQEFREERCVDAESGIQVSASCCCFVASSSGLSADQIEVYRGVRDWASDRIPGFKEHIAHTYPRWGPELASRLRQNPTLRRFAHDSLAPAADLGNLVQKKWEGFKASSEAAQMRQQQRDSRLR